jgi:hypothetical protein
VLQLAAYEVTGVFCAAERCVTVGYKCPSSAYPVPECDGIETQNKGSSLAVATNALAAGLALIATCTAVVVKEQSALLIWPRYMELHLAQQLAAHLP